MDKAGHFYVSSTESRYTIQYVQLKDCIGLELCVQLCLHSSSLEHKSMTGTGLVHRLMTGMAGVVGPGGLAACKWQEAKSGVMMSFTLTWNSY